MHAYVYQGPGQGSWESVSDAGIEQPTDAVVRVDATTVCVGDLHALQGEVSDVRPGTILGHEAVGEVLDVGTEVHDIVPGDDVIVSSISSCGHCMACWQGVFGQCTQGGGWLLGREVGGTQADFVRVPFADHSVHKLPYGMDRDTAVLFSEVAPTAFELGVRNGKVRPGTVVVVVGAGPIGLAAMIIAGIYSPARVISVDLLPQRLTAARSMGADDAELPGRLIADLSEGPGADVVIEAAGSSDSFVLCTQVVRSGGRIANIGMHETPVSLHLEQLSRKNITISTGQVDTSSIPWLLDVLTPEHVEAISRIITERREIEDIRAAYDIASRATSTNALRTILHPGRQ